METIKERAFAYCHSLRTLTFPQNIRTIEFGILTNCTSLSHIVIPEGITTIPPRAFYDCSALTTVSLPSTLKNIGHDAFNSCKKIESIIIPEGVTTIESGAFSDCEALQKYNFLIVSHSLVVLLFMVANR